MTMIDEARQCLDALSQAVTDSGNLDLLVWGELPNQWSAFWLATCGGPALLTAIDTAAARIEALEQGVAALRIARERIPMEGSYAHSRRMIEAIDDLLATIALSTGRSDR